MKITDYDFNIERESLVRPFKFKGGAFTEKWINIVAMRTADGDEAVGIGSTAILWSDPAVFSAHSEAGGNLLMSGVSEHACKLLLQNEFSSPVDGITKILPELYEYATQVTCNPDLRPTFTLNSLIAPDNTLWKLYGLEHDAAGFDELLNVDYPGVFTEKNESLACLPLITYNVSIDEIKKFVESGVFFLRLK